MKHGWYSRAALLLYACRVGSVVAAGPASDTRPGDVERGQMLARAWCAQCHAVERGAQPPFAGVPRFVDVADMPSTTAASLHAFLATPHGGDMPAVKLKADELDAIVAYVLSLKVR
jgi:mono/diheme cytochrome c family protein